MDSLLETQLGSYELLSVLDMGGMAAIFIGRHSVTRQTVAVKVLRRDLQQIKDPIDRLLQEGRVICSLHHEHIVRVYDYGTADSLAFIAMERLFGRSLADLLDEEESLSANRAAFVATQMCAGLAAAHARGVFHRDIKPANVFLADRQRHRDFVKLLDFGIAKLGSDDPSKIAVTATGMTLGTPEYMSPEQATASAIDARSDIYQVGLVLYEMLVGRPPFEHANPVRLMKAHLNMAPPPLRGINDLVPPELEAVVLQCLAKPPDRRFQTAEALQAALTLFITHETDEGSTLIPSIETRRGVSLGDLSLPTLGSPGDALRYWRNLEAGLEHLWPDGDVPAELHVLQEAIAELTREHRELEQILAERRALADELALQIEDRLRPLERAVASLEAELDVCEAELAEVQAGAARWEREMERHDADYARVYDAIESHQSMLYRSDGAGHGVDFRDLYQENIAADLEKLEGIFRRRTEAAEAMRRQQQDAAERMPELMDLRVQLGGLRRSILEVECERVGALAERELAAAEALNRFRVLERELEHRHLQLGIAFRRAVSNLLD